MTDAVSESDTPTSAVTLVIGHTAAPRVSKREVRRWLDRRIEGASASPGFFRGDIQAPEPHRLDDWLVVAEFASRRDLTAWLTSPERARLIAREPTLFLGPPRQQVLATPDSTRSVTAVSSFPVRPGPEGDFAAPYQRLLDAVSVFDGFIRCELIPAMPDIQRETVVVFSFTSRPALDAWLESEARQSILADIRPRLTDEGTMNVVAGFGGWFKTPDRAPRVWKQASLVLLALYPTSLLLGWLRRVALPDLPFAAAVLVVNILGVAVLSWLLLPTLYARYQRWLRR